MDREFSDLKTDAGRIIDGLNQVVKIIVRNHRRCLNLNKIPRFMNLISFALTDFPLDRTLKTPQVLRFASHSGRNQTRASPSLEPINGAYP